MSVLIRGMEMPDDCGACPLETDYGTCGYYSLFVEAGHDSEIWKRRDDCPLIELPPHGRLIDADAFTEYVRQSYEAVKDEFETLGYRELAKNLADGICFDIKEAQTVIEAERG